MFCKIDVREIKYRKDSDAKVHTCVVYVTTVTYGPDAKIICAEFGLLIKTFKVSSYTLTNIGYRIIYSPNAVVTVFCVWLGLGFI